MPPWMLEDCQRQVRNGKISAFAYGVIMLGLAPVVLIGALCGAASEGLVVSLLFAGVVVFFWMWGAISLIRYGR